jgi:hypothetical protein
MRVMMVVGLVGVGWAGAAAQERPAATSSPRWLAAAGVDARSSVSRAVHLGAERLLAPRFSLRLAGDYLTQGSPSDTSGTFTNAVGAALLASYSASSGNSHQYVLGGIGIQRSWSTSRLDGTPAIGVNPVACPAVIPGICPVRDPIGSESAGGGPLPAPPPGRSIPISGAESTGGSAIGSATSSFTYPTLMAGVGSRFRVSRVTGFTELRISYIAVGQQRGRYFMPVTLGITF